MRASLPSAAALLAFGLAASTAAQGDPEAGREVFRQCILCHAIGCNKGAPRLEGVFGRAAGSLCPR